LIKVWKIKWNHTISHYYDIVFLLKILGIIRYWS
jgi:hypothetical protein